MSNITLKEILNKKNIDVDEVELKKHEEMDFLCVGYEYKGQEELFEIPIDTTASIYNTVENDGFSNFSVYHVEEGICSLLENVKGSTIEIFLGPMKDQLFFKNKNQWYELSYDYLGDQTSFLVDNFLKLKFQRTQEILEFEMLHNIGEIIAAKIVMLYKEYKNEITVFNSNGEQEKELTGRTTAEVGIHLLSSDTKDQFLVVQTGDYLVNKGDFEIDWDEDVYDLGIKYGLKRSREI